MSKIIIEEQDLTTTGVVDLEGTDIVYVPGFSSLDSGAEAYVPTLCSSIKEFESYFGDTPATFNKVQSYVDDKVPASYSFSSYAYDESHPNMFESGAPDPSYIYAKELLTAGIPVLYERMNKETSYESSNYDVTVHHMYDRLTKKFTKKAELISVDSTFKNTETKYFKINPSSTSIDTFSDKYKEAGTYKFLDRRYRASSTATAFSYNWFDSDEAVLTEKRPSDWRKTYVNYFTKVEETSGDTYFVKNVKSDPEVIPGWTKNTYYDLGNIIGTVADLATIGISIDKKPTTLTDEDTVDTVLSVTYQYAESELLNKGDYQFKYLTTGGYPSFECNDKALAQSMATLAKSRGDCVALIDHTNYADRPLTNYKSVYVNAKSSELKLSAESQSFASMFTPWASYLLAANYGTNLNQVSILPGSFAYLMSLASSISSNPNWYSISGATRGKVPSIRTLNTVQTLTNAIADSYQPDTELAINPITNIKPYGLCIWGNRTLVDNSIKGGTTAISYLNIRNLVSDIKKQLYVACKKLMFEQNTEILWANFLAMTTPLLDQMVSGSGISGYKVIRVSSDTKASIKAVVRIYPVYAVESFDLTVILQDSDSSIEE